MDLLFDRRDLVRPDMKIECQIEQILINREKITFNFDSLVHPPRKIILFEKSFHFAQIVHDYILTHYDVLI